MATRCDIGPYALEWAIGQEAYERRRLSTSLVDEIGSAATAKQINTLTVHETETPHRTPMLLVVVSHDPWYEGHQPNVGILFVPETHILFVGAGDVVLAYDLHGPTRLWREEAEYGFWYWQRHDDYVLMAAETELAAWTIHGDKQWETFVEPPYDYIVAAGVVNLTVMDVAVSFALKDGPAWSRTLPWIR